MGNQTANSRANRNNPQSLKKQTLIVLILFLISLVGCIITNIAVNTASISYTEVQATPVSAEKITERAFGWGRRSTTNALTVRLEDGTQEVVSVDNFGTYTRGKKATFYRCDTDGALYEHVEDMRSTLPVYPATIVFNLATFIFLITSIVMLILWQRSKKMSGLTQGGVPAAIPPAAQGAPQGAVPPAAQGAAQPEASSTEPVAQPPRPSQTQGTAPAVNPEAPVDIVRTISGNDLSAVQEAQECVEQTMSWYQNHQDAYGERGLDEECMEDGYGPRWMDDEGRMNNLRWIGIVDILIAHKYATERDHSDLKEDYVGMLTSLENFQKLLPDFDKSLLDGVLDEKGWIVPWFEQTDAVLSSQGCVVAALDIESDSYVIFPCRTEDLEKLAALAAATGNRIDYARNM